MAPFEILLDKGLIDPEVLIIGLERNWIEPETAVAYAVERLSDGDERLEIVELAGSDGATKGAMVSLLRRLAGDSLSRRRPLMLWMFANLKDIADSNASADTKLDRLEETYAAFDYAEELRECSRYYVPPHDRTRGIRVGESTTSSPIEAMNKAIEKLTQDLRIG